jgi:transcriptional regulator with XRE-family HTH domain
MTEESSKQIAKKLKSIRRSQGLTQADVASKAGISTNYYARVERGEVRLSVETLIKIAKALKIDPGKVLPSS